MSYKNLYSKKILLLCVYCFVASEGLQNLASVRKIACLFTHYTHVLKGSPILGAKWAQS